MPWTPLLEGQLADEAARAAHAIAVAVAAEPPRDASPADRTVFWAYASHAFDEPFANASYDAALADLIAELRGGIAYPALYGGLAGLGWALCHVIDGDAEPALSVIDEALVALLSIEPWNGPADLVQGLVGYGVYFLERIAHAPAPIARDGLERVVAHLARSAIRSDAGVTWLTAFDLMPAHYQPEWPDGHYDCGVAHGVPGVIALLSRAARIADAPAGTHALRDDAVRWMVAQRCAATGFPAMVYPGRPAARARTAWCYGDPGVASALWDVAPQLALDIARSTVGRSAEECGVRDAGLCHGSLGLAHLYNRFYQASGDRTFASAARTWFEYALAARRSDGIAGFPAWRGDAKTYQPIENVLEGAMGVALALLAAIKPDEPCWDRLLLCDLGGS
jgi:lantibiotic biosynthesis protein